jgi:hypothetical protein
MLLISADAPHDGLNARERSAAKAGSNPVNRNLRTFACIICRICVPESATINNIMNYETMMVPDT